MGSRKRNGYRQNEASVVYLPAINENMVIFVANVCSSTIPGHFELRTDKQIMQVRPIISNIW